LAARQNNLAGTECGGKVRNGEAPLPAREARALPNPQPARLA
jgi:hypothetical protein